VHDHRIVIRSLIGMGSVDSVVVDAPRDHSNRSIVLRGQHRPSIFLGDGDDAEGAVSRILPEAL
jgi:hypothetical protein